MTEQPTTAEPELAPDEASANESTVIAARALAARAADSGLEARLREVLVRELDGAAPTVDTYEALLQRLVALFGPESEWEAHFLLTFLGLPSEEEEDLQEIIALLDDSDREQLIALLRVLRSSFVPQMEIVLAMRDRPGEDWLQLDRRLIRRLDDDTLEAHITFERNDRSRLEIRTSPFGLLSLNVLLLRMLNELPEDQDALIPGDALTQLQTELRYSDLRYGSADVTPTVDLD